MNLQRLAVMILSIACLVSTGVAGGPGKPSQAPAAKKTPGGLIMKTRENSHYLPGRVIVKLKQPVAGLVKGAATFGLGALDAAASTYGVESVSEKFPAGTGRMKDVDMSRFVVMKYSRPYDAFAVAEELSHQPGVEYAEPWFVYPVETGCLPNDTLIGLNYIWPVKQIKADSAWCVTTGDTSVVIGIDDTGVQWDHPDLAANIWINPGEWGDDGLGGRKETNGIDDDNDGKVDDWHGWDFGGADYNSPAADNDPGPKNQSSSHGTHVAGIASAATNNHIGMAGIGYRCKILPIKTSSDNDTRFSGTPGIVFGLEGMYYAADMGADVVNCSWGGSGYSQFEQDVVDSVARKGVLVVAAAGNSGTTDLNYPASYRGVVSVASTGYGDAFSSFSQHNEAVSVTAPGYYVYSTYYPNNYTWMSGTSMSTPHVAGLAGLVKSVFPTFTPRQIGEQIRATADDIDGTNPAYVGMMGRGRINAYRAVTATTPSVRIESWEVRDSDGVRPAVPQANTVYTLIMSFENYLTATDPGTVISLVSSDTSSVQVTAGTFPVGALATMATASNASSPFRIYVKSAAAGLTVPMYVNFNGGAYNDRQTVILTLNPIYATHAVNNLQVTMVDNGRIGYTDMTNSKGVGCAFRGVNELYEAGLIVGLSPAKLLDCVRNTDGAYTQDADFSYSGLYTIADGDPVASEIGSGAFGDSTAPLANRIGLRIKMHSYAFGTPADSNYVIIKYDIMNVSGADISNTYAGLFFDWDMQPDIESNRSGFDSTRALGYAWDTLQTVPVYCGARSLDGKANFRGLLVSSADLSRASKWNWISGGVVPNDTVGDVHFAISYGPLTIANGASTSVEYAICAGSGLAGIQASADAALAKWNIIKDLVGVRDRVPQLPETFALEQNYPNPFNPATSIQYSVGEYSSVTIRIYNILGEEVASLLNGTRQRGTYTMEWNASGLPTGVYFYRMDAAGLNGPGKTFSSVKKMMLVR